MTPYEEEEAAKQARESSSAVNAMIAQVRAFNEETVNRAAAARVAEFAMQAVIAWFFLASLWTVGCWVWRWVFG